MNDQRLNLAESAAATRTGRQRDKALEEKHGYTALEAQMKRYLDRKKVRLVRKAYDFAVTAHEGQTRKSGEDYIAHPIAVASLLAEIQMDDRTLAAAILHDTIEDTGTPKALIVELFSEEVAELVDGVSKISRSFESKAHAQAENFRKMLMAMARDIRVIIIKLADRLHNMHTLGSLPPAKRRRIAQETLEIHAPIANRLGMNRVRVELEDLAFAHLHPWRYNIFATHIKSARDRRQVRADLVEEEIRDDLSEQDITGRVTSREKHLYGIYQKIEKRIQLDRQRAAVRGRDEYLKQVQDIYGVRIIVESVSDCYRALGIVHNLYRPVLGRFKDYIAIPKANGYQSLHTTLNDHTGTPFEVQIRTEAMHQVAEAGIAAHWLYKAADDPLHASHSKAKDWLHNLVEMQGKSDDSLDFYEQVKIDLFPDEVYVFSPMGDIFRLPRGATAVDFAYAVHTDIGNRCFGVRIDGRRMLLRTKLQSGQTVEILLDENAHPDPKWLDFAVTAKARSNVRHYLQQLEHDDAVRIGRQLLDRALVPHNLTIGQVENMDLSEALNSWKLQDIQQLYKAIGLGERVAPVVARRIVMMHDDSFSNQISTGLQKFFELPAPLKQILPGRILSKATRQPKPMLIRGTEGLTVKFAGCCQPIPGDRIVGFLSAGLGVVIHDVECRNAQNIGRNPDKWISCEWDENLDRDFPVSVEILVANRRGVLAELASAVSQMDSDIENIQIEDRDGQRAILRFTLRVFGRKHLADIMRVLRKIKHVETIHRR